MRIEGVTFVEHAVCSMTKADFIKIHMPVVWQNRSEVDRKKMLSDTYDLIKKKGTEVESDSELNG